MANSAKRKTDEGEQKSVQDHDIEIPAIRHVGPTLESDPEYLSRIGSGGSTPEAQIAEEASRTEPDLRRLQEQGIDTIVGGEMPEPLKTRLPGDTSSDPHTDVGPENAATVQRRGERAEKKRNAA